MTTTKEVTDISLHDLTATTATFNVWYGDNTTADRITIDVPHAPFDDMLADAWTRIEQQLPPEPAFSYLRDAGEMLLA